MSETGPATDLLLHWSSGDEGARDDLLPIVYDELRRIARSYLQRERSDHTLQPTALVHEAYLRLIDQRRVSWRNRAQFVGLAAIMMRRVLVNHARHRAAAKRNGDGTLPLTVTFEPSQSEPPDVIEVHDALDRLQTVDARAGRIVELKFFGGLTTEEMAEVMQLSPATIEREWRFARAWLYDAINGDSPVPR
jgi:RNA polymerase sigma factor (TIGR02999 family)